MKLPIGISTFSEIRSGDYLYVDKTEFAFDLISDHKYIFLSRPRRFGKSLFLDTLKEIFEGNRELFKGLYIEGRYDFPVHPVIKISFGGNRSVKELLDMLAYSMRRNGERLGVECTNEDYAVCFSELIHNASEKYGPQGRLF